MKNNDIKFETLRKPIRKKIIISSIVLVAIVSAITLTTSRAKYRLTQSIPVVRGKIYYYNGDLNVMAMYKQKDGSTCTDDSCYDEMAETDRMPSSGYVINETKSYCKIVDTIDNEAKIYTNDNGEHVISNLRKKDKCYLYFDKVTLPPIILSDNTESCVLNNFTGNTALKYTTDDGNTWTEIQLSVGDKKSFELPVGAKVYNTTGYGIHILDNSKNYLGDFIKTNEYVVTGKEVYYAWTGCNGRDCMPAC